MENALQLNNQLQQKQLLSQRQRQALEFLQLPLADLELRLDRELTENPLLEEEFPGEPIPEAEKDQPEKEDESTLAERIAEADSWQENLPIPGDSGEEKNDFWSNVAAPGPDLIEMLEREIAGCSAPEVIKNIARMILLSLDDSGFVATPLADIAMSCDATLEETESALELLQSFDPPGIAARNLPECLVIQLRRFGNMTPVLEKLFAFGLEKVAQLPLTALSRKLGETPEALKTAMETLRRLNPAPAGDFARASEVITPELEFYRDKDGAYRVRMLRENRRRIVISPAYANMLASPAELSAADRRYIEEKLARAKEVLQALESRRSTLLRLGEEIVRVQEDFFLYGVRGLHPFTMKQAGDALQLHETTISRAISGKYALTPRGVLPLKYFFSGGFADADGDAVSSRAVEERIRELISAEDPAKPLPDDAVAKVLQGEGINIARRTVAKYRDKLGIPPSSRRGEQAF